MDALILILLSLVIVFLGITIIAIGYFYSKLVIKFSHTEKENLYLRFHVQEKSLQKINAAKEKSMVIIATAAQQAEELLKRAEFLKGDISEQAKQEFDTVTAQQKDLLLKASADLTKTFEEILTHIQQEDINVIQNVTKDFEKTALQEVKTFGEQLKQNTVGQQKIVDQKIEQAFTSAQSEIEEYKRKKIGEADKQIYALLEQVTKDVIGKSLSYQDHKDLIMTALKKATEDIVC